MKMFIQKSIIKTSAIQKTFRLPIFSKPIETDSISGKTGIGFPITITEKIVRKIVGNTKIEINL